MSDTPAIYGLMTEVKRDVGVIGKNDRNKHFGFNFRGIDSVFNAFHQPMVNHGLNAVPHDVYDVEYVQAGDAVRCRLKMTIRIYAPDGSYVDADGAGEAIDKQDKATAQASQQAFSVPTKELEDSDAAGPVAQQSAPASGGPVCDGCGETLAGASGVKVQDGKKFHADCAEVA